MKNVIGGRMASMALASMIGAILSPVAASAAEASANSLEEIVVTAQRREERLQDVPISVSAYGQATLDAQSIRSIDDVSRLAPGVKHLAEKNYQDKVRLAIEQYLGERVQLKLQIGETAGESAQDRAVESISKDEFVRGLMEQFDATLDDSSIKPGR